MMFQIFSKSIYIAIKYWPTAALLIDDDDDDDDDGLCLCSL